MRAGSSGRDAPLHRPALAALVVALLLVACAGPSAPTPATSAGASPGGTAAPLDPPGSPAASGSPGAPTSGPSLGPDARVEAALAELDTDEELVGQLLLVGWKGTSADGARAAIEGLRPGGMVYVANGARAERATQVNLGLDGIAAGADLLPLLKAIDHEGGTVWRIEDLPNPGSNLDFALAGASEADACARGAEHARQLLEMGFDMNLAPVLDVNTNPDSPIIGDRSYGARPTTVARLGSAYIRGLQAGGIAAVAKHFPGHGDTTVDSHVALPVLGHGRERLDRVELVPFRRSIDPNTDVAAVMTAHIALPRIDPSGLPATLSEPVLGGILRDDLGYDGLIVSDDLAAMDAITDSFQPGVAAVGSIAAGADMLIVVGDLERQRATHAALLAALTDGTLSRERITAAVRNVLAVKARFGLLGGDPRPEPGCGG